MRNKKYKCCRQNNETECGAACLATICWHYGINAELPKIRELACVDRYGANLLGLKNAATALGFSSEGLSGNMDDLVTEDLRFPYIAHIVKEGKLEHFVVVFEQTENGFVIGDPAAGLVNYTHADFAKVWTGHILSLEPHIRMQNQRNKKSRPLLGFMGLVLQQKSKILPIAILSMVATLLLVATSFFSYYLFDVLIPSSLVTRLVSVAFAIILIHLLIFALNYFRARLIAVLAKKINYDLFCKYIATLLHIDYKVYEQFTTGDLVARLQDTDMVREALSQLTITLSLDVVMMFAGVTVLAIIDWKLMVISLCVMALYAIAIAAFNAPISEATSKLREADSITTDTFLDTINGIEDVKTCVYETHMLSRNEGNIGVLMEAFRHATIVFSAQTILAETIMAIGEVIVLSTGAIGIIYGEMSIGAVLMFYSLFTMCINPTKNILNLLPTVRKAEISAQRLYDIFSMPIEDSCIDNECDELTLTGNLSVTHLRFRYGNRDLVLDGLSFEIKDGEHISLLGESGSGKSTLIKLLLRLYKAESGEICIGGRNIDTIPLSILRKQIAYISQTPHLFRGSVLENICMGLSESSKESMISFLDRTSYKECINAFPMGYDTVLTENGENLSGGQRQLVIIGRALAKRAEILILDEATSALDQRLKAIVYQAIEEVYGSKTIIVVSHETTDSFPCNRSITLCAGRIV